MERTGSEASYNCLLGAGGHAESVLHVLLSLGLDVHFAVGGKALRDTMQGFADDRTALAALPPKTRVVLAVGSCAVRLKLMDLYRAFVVLTPIAPTASVAPSATIGPGTVVHHQAHVGPGTTIGPAAVVNSGAIVEHDCAIGPGTHCAPGSTILGGATVGRAALIGAGAVVLPGVDVNDGCIVGAGAVVTRSVPSGLTVVGSPAHSIK